MGDAVVGYGGFDLFWCKRSRALSGCIVLLGAVLSMECWVCSGLLPRVVRVRCCSLSSAVVLGLVHAYVGGSV